MLNVNAIMGYDVVDYSKENENYILLTITGDTIDIEKERMPISVVALLDISGSMSPYEKIGYLKKSVIKLIDNLKPTDKLSIITYSTHAKKVFDLIEMNPDNKKRAYSIVNSLSTLSMTNMSEAMILGYEEFRNAVIEDGVNRIILFTDGCPTSGNCNHKDLVHLAENVPEGVQLTTMGYGKETASTFKEIDVALLQDMATAGKGNYYYMSDPDSCGRAFANELAGLLSVVAQNIKIKVTPKHVVLDDVLDDVDASKKDNNMEISLIDIMAEETKYILLKIKTEKQNKIWVRPGTIAIVDVEYMNPIVGKIETVSLNVKMEFKKNGLTKKLNTDVETQLAILTTIANQEKANNYARSGDFTMAKNIMQQSVTQFSNIDNSRAHDYYATLGNASALYDNFQSFSASEGVRSATFNSMRGGRASGGLIDNLYVTNVQKSVQDNFSFDAENKKIDDVDNTKNGVIISHPTFIDTSLLKDLSVTTTTSSSNDSWVTLKELQQSNTSLKNDNSLIVDTYVKKTKIERW